MSLKNMTIKHGGTVAVTGGTDFVFADDGVSIQNGVHLVVPATTSYAVRESVTCKYKPPTLMTDGSYSRDKKTMSFTAPILLASGKVVNNVLRIERELHPELSAADASEINSKCAQMLFDTDASGFWATGSLS